MYRRLPVNSLPQILEIWIRGSRSLVLLLGFKVTFCACIGGCSIIIFLLGEVELVFLVESIAAPDFNDGLMLAHRVIGLGTWLKGKPSHPLGIRGV